MEPWSSAVLEFVTYYGYQNSNSDDAKAEVVGAAQELAGTSRLEEQHPFHPRSLENLLKVLRRPEWMQHAEKICAADGYQYLIERIATEIDLVRGSAGRASSILASRLLFYPHLTWEQWLDTARMLFKGTRRSEEPKAWVARKASESWSAILDSFDFTQKDKRTTWRWRELVLDSLARFHFTNIILYDTKLDFAYVLPARVDILSDSASVVSFVVESKTLVIDKSFRAAVEAGWHSARATWRAKHGLWPQNIKGMVGNCSLQVDLRAAEAVIAKAADLLGRTEWPFLLWNQSAALPICLAGIARLMGYENTSAVLATGPIGDFGPLPFEGIGRVPLDKEEDDAEVDEGHVPEITNDVKRLADVVLDSRVEWNLIEDEELRSSLCSKIQVARSYSNYERLILPADSGEEFLEPLHEGPLEIHPVPTKFFSTAVDAFVPDQWRQTTYVRAPDIRWHFHNRRQCSEIVKFEPLGEAELLSAFRRALCVNVYGQNFTEGYQVVHSLIRLRKRLAERGVPFIRWAYLKCTAEETGQRFWRVLLETLRAMPQEVEDFHCAKSWDGKAGVLAGILNDFHPTWERRQRCGPNILILDAFDSHFRHFEKEQIPSRHAYHIPEILTRLALLLGPHANGRHREELGRVRLILISREPLPESWNAVARVAVNDSTAPWYAENVAHALEALAVDRPSLAEVVLRASVFRHNFSTNGLLAACWDILLAKESDFRFISALGLGSKTPVGIDVGDARDELTTLDIFRYLQGEYHLNPVFRAWVWSKVATLGDGRPELRKQLADLHLRAAYYFTPHFAPDPFSTVLESNGLQGVQIHEADYHCQAAMALRRREEGTHAEEKLQQNIVRYLDESGLERAGRLFRLKLHQHAAEDIEDWQLRCGIKDEEAHPLWIGRRASAYSAEAALRPKETHAGECVRKAQQLFLVALMRWSSWKDAVKPEEAHACGRILKADYSEFLFRHCKDEILEATKLLNDLLAEDGYIPADMLMAAGDTSLDLGNVSSAIQYYNEARKRSPRFIQPWLMLAGICLYQGDCCGADELLREFCETRTDLRKAWHTVTQDLKRHAGHAKKYGMLPERLVPYTRAIERSVELRLLRNIPADDARKIAMSISESVATIRRVFSDHQ